MKGPLSHTSIDINGTNRAADSWSRRLQIFSCHKRGVVALTLTFISHDAFAADVRALAAALKGTPEWQPSLLIGMGRGGLVPAVYLSHAADLPMISCDLSSHATAFADATLARLAERTRVGARLLFVDDINDSGRTIGILRRRLGDFDAAPGSVRFATLLDNEVSAERVEYRARTIDRRVVKDWFVFPWEALASKEAIAEDAAEVPERIQ